MRLLSLGIALLAMSADARPTLKRGLLDSIGSTLGGVLDPNDVPPGPGRGRGRGHGNGPPFDPAPAAATVPAAPTPDAPVVVATPPVVPVVVPEVVVPTVAVNLPAATVPAVTIAPASVSTATVVGVPSPAATIAVPASSTAAVTATATPGAVSLTVSAATPSATAILAAYPTVISNQMVSSASPSPTNLLTSGLQTTLAASSSSSSSHTTMLVGVVVLVLAAILISAGVLVALYKRRATSRERALAKTFAVVDGIGGGGAGGTTTTTRGVMTAVRPSPALDGYATRPLAVRNEGTPYVRRESVVSSVGSFDDHQETSRLIDPGSSSVSIPEEAAVGVVGTVGRNVSISSFAEHGFDPRRTPSVIMGGASAGGFVVGRTASERLEQLVRTPR